VILRRTLKKNDFSFKRILHSLEARRDESDFRNTQGLLKALHKREDQGELAFYYFNESGFLQSPSVPYAWNPIGKPCEVTACSQPKAERTGLYQPSGKAGLPHRDQTSDHQNGHRSV
jgi:hypothetical protein